MCSITVLSTALATSVFLAAAVLFYYILASNHIVPLISPFPSTQEFPTSKT